MKFYDHKKIEKKWRRYWEEKKLYKTPEKPSKRDKMYVLPQLPYPSGSGLHVGHAEVYSACDIYARFQRMKGKKVLQAVGWDAFGLPAENYAIKTNIHPRINTDKAIDNFREQIKSLGISIDWDREVGTHNPDYYKWTQWFFLLMYKRGLAYRKKQSVNWDPVDKTVLANEQVLPDGTAERSGAKVEQRMMDQWFLKITDYADRLLEDLNKVDWPEETVKRQSDWIGRSEGARVVFKIAGSRESLEVFTTRPDTIFGATFMVIAPEHEILGKLEDRIKNISEVNMYIDEAKRKTELQRQQQKDKTGIRLEGITAINPATEGQIPIFVADYVLAGYGTGAIMAVPGHDERDFEFAVKYKLPIVRVVKPIEDCKSIILKQSVKNDFRKTLESQGFHTGKSIDGHIIVDFQRKKLKEYVELIQANISRNFFVDVIGAESVMIFNDVLLRADTPDHEEEAIAEIAKRFPRLFKTRKIHSLMAFQYGDESETSGFYHDLLIFAGDGEAVNSGKFDGFSTREAKTAITDWLIALNAAEREVNYKLRDWSISRQRFWGAPIPMVYDADGEIHPVAEEDLPVILPNDVDFKPTGQSPLTYSEKFQEGVETKYGKGWKREVDTLDTFMCSSWYYFRYLDPKNDNAFASKEALKAWMPVDFYLGGPEHVNGHLLYSRFFTKVLFDAGYIDFDEPFLVHRHQGTILGEDNRKMSKRWGNVINPTDVVEKYGADTARVYEMFMGPLDQDKAWNDKAVQGVRRFLQRVHNFGVGVGESNPEGEQNAMLHKLVKKVSDDTPKLRFNTAIAEFMKVLNWMEANKEQVNINDWKTYLKLLAPFAPFITEELWMVCLKKEKSIHLEMWPEYDPKKIAEQKVTIAVQVDGKLRETFVVERGASEKDVTQHAVKMHNVNKYLQEKELIEVIYVPDRVINFVTKLST